MLFSSKSILQNKSPIENKLKLQQSIVYAKKKLLYDEGKL
jgi:hypothetical protein